jgi:uncharacterized membrane protein YphA (DoxX/SURF4 family)
MPNPFSDAWNFLIGNTDDHNALGNWKYLLIALFWALIIGCIAIAVRNWRDDPLQRTPRNIVIFLVRVLTGSMWFQGMIWKLPLPVSDGLQYWTEQMGTRAAFEFHREFVTNFLVPHLYLFGPLVFLAELFFSASLILGFVVRLAGVIAILYVLHLWLGLYRPGDPAEWPWTYVFLVFVMFFLVLDSAGRSLGLDALLRREFPAPQDGRGILRRLFDLVS